MNGVVQGGANFAWAAVAVVLLLVTASVDPKIGGWLLLVLVLGMVGVAHKRHLI